MTIVSTVWFVTHKSNSCDNFSKIVVDSITFVSHTRHTIHTKVIESTTILRCITYKSNRINNFVILKSDSVNEIKFFIKLCNYFYKVFKISTKLSLKIFSKVYI